MNTDLRLKAAYDLIDSGKIKVLSVDIFDTLLWRQVPIPTDIFLILGKQLKEQGWLIEAVSSDNFPQLRASAEQLARIKKSANPDDLYIEVTMRDIYWNLSGIFKKITFEQMRQGQKGIFNEHDVDEPIALEVAIEKKMSQFDLNIVNLIRYAVEKGIRVALVSDTYFEKSHIETILERPDFPLPLISQLFISCEYGYGKRKGLFAELLTEMNVSPEKVLHIGDNWLSDCVGAQNAGINALYYPKFSPEFNEIINREWSLEDLSQRRRQLDHYEGDFGLTSLRSKITFHTDLVGLNPEDTFYWKYGASVLGPLFAGFIRYIYERTKQLGVNEVFCIMREGRFYGKLIKEMASYYPDSKLVPKELWISRHFLLNSAVYQGSIAELTALTTAHPAVPFTVTSYCKMLGLDASKIPKFRKHLHTRLNVFSFADEIIAHLSGQPELREQIIINAAEKRSRFLKYLSTLTDLSSLTKMVFVDVGWVGSIQGIIQGLLYSERHPTVTHGLYFATRERCQLALLQGNIREGYLMKVGIPKDASNAVALGPYPIIEQVAIGGIGAMIDLDEKGEIITTESHASDRQAKNVEMMQHGVIAFCHQLFQYIQNGALTWNAFSEEMLEQLRSTLIRAATYPTKEEAQLLGEWHHDHVSGRSGGHAIGNDRYYEKHIANITPQNGDQVSSDWGMVWPPAYAAKHDKNLVLAQQSIRLKRLPKECFLSHDSVRVKVFIDHGAGFPKKATRNTPIHSNVSRSFSLFEEFFSIKKPIKRVRLELIIPRSLIRIKTLRFTIRRNSTNKVQQRTFFESRKTKHHLEIQTDEQFEHNLFYSNGSNLTLTYTFELVDIYYVGLNLCFEKFEVKRALLKAAVHNHRATEKI